MLTLERAEEDVLGELSSAALEPSCFIRFNTSKPSGVYQVVSNEIKELPLNHQK